MRPWWTADMADTENGSFVTQTMLALGFCCCGRPEVVVDQLRQYMESCADKAPPGAEWKDWYSGWRARHPIIETDAGWWAAYTADRMGWTEHGGGVMSAWVDGPGHDWLEDARKWKVGRLGQ